VASFPDDTSWWIKVDAVDIVSGLGESVNGVWSGDVDLNDGKLQELYQEYKGQQELINSLILLENRTNLCTALNNMQRYLDTSLEFVTASKSYQLEIVLYSLT